MTDQCTYDEANIKTPTLLSLDTDEISKQHEELKSSTNMDNTTNATSIKNISGFTFNDWSGFSKEELIKLMMRSLADMGCRQVY